MTTDHEQAGDCPDELDSLEEEVEDPVEEENRRLMEKIQDFPIQTSQQRNAEMLAALPPLVKRRLKALKKLQLDATHLEAKFFKEVHDLECRYHRLYIPLYDKRGDIINGKYEPTEEECQWPSDDEEEELRKALKEKAKIQETNGPEENKKKDPKGIPQFWINVFKNCTLLTEMVQPQDTPILCSLTDIRMSCKEEPMSFLLEFHFAPNDYFTNTVLTKEYFMKCVPDEDDPFGFEGPEIYKCVGCTINWNKGKNVTIKTIKKKQKHKSRGVVRVITKTVPSDSFFNFFSPPTIPEETKDQDVDEDLRNLLTSDFEIGHYIRERIIPRAVLYFTGENSDEEDDYEEEEEDDDEEEEPDSDLPSIARCQENCKQQ